MNYVERVLNNIKEKYSHEKEFVQAVTEVLESLKVVILKDEEFYEKNAILERLVTPDRIIKFRVPWVNDKGEIKVNMGYRIQWNNAIGPYKGGLRLHPSVNESILKFLAFEQTFKNSLTTLPMGGGKGGSDFDPKGKSDREVMAFCQSFMTELYKYIGPNTDVPAGDIGVGAREIGYLYGQYKRLTSNYEGVLTGKGLTYGGSLIRTEATGYGLLYMTEALLTKHKMSLKDKKIVVSGAGNVAIYAIEKAYQLGALPITCSDSNGFIYDPNGIDLALLKELKEVQRVRIKEYLNYKKDAAYYEGKKPFMIKCDIALPCATQNELSLEDAKMLVDNGVIAVLEGANMPSTLEATAYFKEHHVLFVPGKAANAGGVLTSGLEMTQNSMRLSWTREEVDNKLKAIMNELYQNMLNVLTTYNLEEDYVLGSNIAGFLKVVDAMVKQGF